MRRLSSSIFIFFGLTWLLAFGGSSLARERLKAQAGELDVSTWDFKKDGPLVTDGEWQFYWKRFFTPDELKAQLFKTEPFTLVQALGLPWKKLPPPVEPRGYATYIMHLKGLRTLERPLSVTLGQFMGTHESWILWPKSSKLVLLGQSGVNTATIEGFIPQYRRIVNELPEMVEDEAWLIVSQSSYIIDGCLYASPIFDEKLPMQRSIAWADRESFLTMGMFGMLILINLALFLLRQEDKPSLLMMIVSANMLLRYICTEGVYFEIFSTPHFTLSMIYMYLMVFQLPFGICAYLEFLKRSFPDFLGRKVVNVCWISFGAWVVSSLIWIETVIPLGYTVWAILTPLTLWSFGGLIRAYRRGVKSSLFAMIGIAVFTLAVNFDYLIYLNLIRFPFLGQYGMVLFTFMQSLVVGYNFAHAFRTADRLSKNLQQEVELQTFKLRLQKERLEEQKRDLVLAHESMQEADDQKTRFFRSISHELRTPLTLILGSLPTAQRENPGQSSLDIVKRNATRLFRLVNQLLDFQKVTLSQTRLRLDKIDLQGFVQGLAPYFVSACQEKGIEFRVDCQLGQQENIRVMAQADALEKIVFNYLANALKFTSRGGHITVELKQTDGFARITVIDDGPGIPEKEQEKLFKLFSQIDGPHQKEQQGTGLGLALVKELAEHMNGKVGVKSRKDLGSAFWVQFPSLNSQDFIDILVLDRDEDDLRDLLEQIRRSAWHGTIKTAQDPEQALQILHTHLINVFMCSTNVGPEMDHLLEVAARQPHCWKVLIATKDKQKSDLRTLHAEAIDAWFEQPLDASFFSILQERAASSQDPDRPILDLIYIEDDPLMQQDVHAALAKYTLLENIKIVSHGEQLRLLLHDYQVRVVMADARLDGERGTDLLAFVSKISPDTFRILLTGETSQATLAAGITDAHAHYIIYKPANLEQEAKAIESYVNRSPIRFRVFDESEQTKSKDWQLAGLELEVRVDEKLGLSTEKPVDAKATILVVDDVSDMRVMVGSILRQAGFHVLFARNGLQALNLLLNAQLPIDIIVSDWLMPELNGPDFIARLRSIEELASIPTILLTAKTDSESKAYATSIGASAYIGKPFDEMELLSTVDNLLDLKKRERRIDELNRFIATNVLQRFLPPDLVEDLVAGKAKFDDAAQLRTITVLFADLCGFTQSTEKLGPERMARILNAFLVRMTDVIFSVGGTIDKFMGDGILVIFGAPRAMDPRTQAHAAAQCARLMQDALTELNSSWLSTEGISFQMRIGIHHGPAIVGSFGGERRSDYTAVGNTVNIASRVETCALPGEILATPVVIEFLDDGLWESAGEFKLKGIEGEMSLFRLTFAVKESLGVA